MEFDEMKNSSFDSSSLEEIQPFLEELEEKVSEPTPEPQQDVPFSSGVVSERTSIVTSKTSVVTRTIRKENLADDADAEDVKNDSGLVAEPENSNDDTSLENTVDETPTSDTSSVLADDIVLDDASLNVNEVINNVSTNVSNVSSNVSNTTTTNTMNMTNTTSSVFDATNSTLNIDTNTINVSATSVVVSGLTDDVDEKKENVDYSHINSHKGSLELSTDEKVIREYRITKSNGKAIVTNKRLVLDCKTRLDLPIEKVGGIASSRRLEIKIASLIFGILFLGICVAGVVIGMSDLIPQAWAQYTVMAVGGVFGLIGLIMIICSFKNKFTLNVFGDGLYSVMVVSRRIRDAKENLQGITIEDRKGKDFAKFTGEIGAILVQAKEELKRK